jgi:hypothetical protein
MQRQAYYPTVPRGGYVITTIEQWASLWEQAHDANNPEALPRVDFDRFVVIAVYAGSQTHGQVRIHIRRIVDTGSSIRVDVEETLPSDGCVTTLDTPNPGELVFAQKVDRPVQFHVDRTIVDCYNSFHIVPQQAPSIAVV